ncbi:hypothetical protein L5515_006851 [Caenorhabditis briggsae]|uniref:Uncharacterized protein n=1 Tax=Caenorhabditis briggsae TaxID=6238 RepID=A0AAE9F5E1_CAEBR|nr:hypothetical protein L5515_006851 [Caenorhabditis briggsae]
MPTGVMNGILTKWGVPSTIQLFLMVTAVSYVSVSTLMIFENRFYLLNSKKKWWKRIRPFWMASNFLFGILYQIPVILEVPDLKYAKEVVINSLPCVPEFLYTADIVLPSLNDTTVILCTVIYVLVIFGQLFVFATIIMVQLSTNFGASTLSGTTRRLQKRLLKALIWQTGIPFLYLVLPGCYSVFSVYTEYFNMMWSAGAAGSAGAMKLEPEPIMQLKSGRKTFGHSGV